MAPPAVTSGMIISCEIRQIRERRPGTWGKGNIPCNGRGAVLVDVQVLCPPPGMGSGFQASKEGFGVQGRLRNTNLTAAMDLGIPVLSPAGGIDSTGCLFPALAKSVLKVSSLDRQISSC